MHAITVRIDDATWAILLEVCEGTGATKAQITSEALAMYVRLMSTGVSCATDSRWGSRALVGSDRQTSKRSSGNDRGAAAKPASKARRRSADPRGRQVVSLMDTHPAAPSAAETA